MSENNIQILGITPQAEFPHIPPHYPSSQICQIDKLFLACQHDIQKILKVIVSVTIRSFKIINTPIGKKVVVQGIKHIKVISAIDKQCHCTHSACFDIPFCLFIKLKDAHTAIAKIGTVVEDVTVECLKDQFLLVSIVIFAYPVFQKENNHCPPDNHNSYQYPNDNPTCICSKIHHETCHQNHCQPDGHCKPPCKSNETDPIAPNPKYCQHENKNVPSTCPFCQQHINGSHTYQSYSDD